MRDLVEAAELRETPVIGAYLLWHFVKAYRATRKEAPNLVLLFIAIGILTNPSLIDYVGRQRTLSCFRRDLLKDKKSDLFARLTDAIKGKLMYTTAALDIAVGAHLLGWNVDTATIKDFPATSAKDEKDVLADHVLKMGAKAEYLGKLFAKYGDGPSVVVELGARL